MSAEDDKKQSEIDHWNSPTERSARKMLRCRVQLGNNQPFFGQLIMHLKVVQKKDLKFKTMATDGTHLYYDPDFVLGKSDDEIKWVICHEVMHCSLKHFLRRQANPDYWNAAADYALNQLISDLPQECGKMPEEALIDPKYKGWTAEMIYQYMLKNNIDLPPDYTNKGKTWRIGDVEDPPPMNGPDGDEDKKDIEGKNSTDCDGKSDGGDSTGDGMKVLERDLSDPEKLGEYWDEILSESLKKNAGTMPENFRRELLKLLQPRVDWKSTLKRFIISLGEKHRYDIPHRRFIGMDDVQWTRTRTKDTFDSMIIIGDTSGSIGQKELTSMVSESYQIMKDFKPKEIQLMWCDSKLHLPVDIVTPKTMHLLHSPRGGGGTDFRPPFEYIKKNILGKRSLGPIVYFTDGEGPFPTLDQYSLKEYRDKVIWVIVGTRGYSSHIKVPFGTRIDLIL